ncbi:hypothetical protein ACXKGW_29330, partial [Klebsiella pneumoniae subsp. pneumoniae]
MTWFEKAGGRTIRGLQLRRGMGDATRIGELELCLAGLDDPASLPTAPQVKPKPKPEPSAPADVPASDAAQEVSPWLFWIVSAAVALLIAGLLVATAAKRARAGDFKGSCHAMTWFEKAGGRTIRGL